MTCAQGLLRLLWGGPKLECYGTVYKCFDLMTLSHEEETDLNTNSSLSEMSMSNGI